MEEMDPRIGYLKLRVNGISHSVILELNSGIQSELEVWRKEYDSSPPDLIQRLVTQKAKVGKKQSLGKPKKPNVSKDSLGGWIAWTRFELDITRQELAQMSKLSITKLTNIEMLPSLRPTTGELIAIYKVLKREAHIRHKSCEIPSEFLSHYPDFQEPAA